MEDHDDLRRYLGLFLGQVGTNVVVARNAFEGLEAIKNNHPNLVISDIKMLGVNGFKLLREIRVLGLDAGGSVPVIAMTAFVTHADHARILTAGFQGSFLSGDIFALFVFFELMSGTAFAPTIYKIEASSIEGALNFAIFNSIANYMDVENWLNATQTNRIKSSNGNTTNPFQSRK